jgi:GTP cyclohydrolase I
MRSKTVPFSPHSGREGEAPGPTKTPVVETKVPFSPHRGREGEAPTAKPVEGPTKTPVVETKVPFSPHRGREGKAPTAKPVEGATRAPLVDVQNMYDSRKIEIDKVGVKGVKYPIVVLDKANGFQHTVAAIDMYVNLPHNYKGTHMSRFLEILHENQSMINMKNLPNILTQMKKRLNAESTHLEVKFPYFIKKEAPVSKAPGYLEYNCGFLGSMDEAGTVKEFTVSVLVPINTLCPCSKEISDHGAHNQRGVARVDVRFRKFFWIEDLIELVETCASSGIYSVLKREDEKYVTEKAFENPKFVEDVVRDIAEALSKDANFTWFAIEAENFESIHNHSAYAYLERIKEGECP